MAQSSNQLQKKKKKEKKKKNKRCVCFGVGEGVINNTKHHGRKTGLRSFLQAAVNFRTYIKEHINTVQVIDFVMPSVLPSPLLIFKKKITI